LPGPLSALDHGERHPVLDRAHRVEGLDLHVHVHTRRRQLAELDERRVADRFQYVVVASHVFLLEGIALEGHPGGGAWQQPWKRAWFFGPRALDLRPGAVGEPRLVSGLRPFGAVKVRNYNSPHGRARAQVPRGARNPAR